MGKNNKLLINMSSYALLQVVNMLVGLFLPRLYLAVYGSEINGVISTVNSFTSYFTYLEAGLGLTLIHSLFKPLADNNNEKINGILAYSKTKYQRISLIYFILVIFSSSIFPFVKETQDMGKLEMFLLVFVIGIFGALDFFTMSKYRVLLTADRRVYVISNAITIAQLCRFILVWIVLQFEMSVVVAKLIPIFTLILRSVILRLYIKKQYPYVNYNANVSSTVETSKSHWDALLLQISISTSVSLPTILISQILDYKEANVFATYNLVINAMILVTSSLSSGVAPTLGKSIAEGKNITNTYKNFDFIVAFVISVVFSITAVMLLPFVELYTDVVDDVNYLRPIYAILMAIWGALYAYRIPVTAVINAAGIYKENRVHNIVNLLLQLIFGTLATVFFGTVGLLVVMIIASVQRNVALTIENDKKLLHTGVKDCILYQVLITALIIVSFMTSYRLVSAVEFTIVKWIVVAVAVAVADGLVCVVAFALAKPKLVKGMVNDLLMKIKK